MESIKTIYKIGKGPSSSHTIGPDIAIRKYLAEHDIDFCEVILYGSLALTGKGHLTDFVISDALNEFGVKHEIHFDFNTSEKDLKHPNTFKIKGYNTEKLVESWTVFSVGGGNIIINSNDNISNEDVYPHSLFSTIRLYCEENGLSLVEYVNKYEKNIDEYLENILKHMLECVERGLNLEGVIHGELNIKRRAKTLFENSKDDIDLKLTAYAYAASEENATGGTIVTAPTCGACGILPAVLYYYKNDLGYDNKLLVDGLKVGGIIGSLIRENASISGAEAGCQAEIGSATSMAAAAIVFLNCKNSTLQQLESAAEIGMEHNLGLTCDPILGYVQIPCIQRNAIGAIKANTAAKVAQIASEMEIVDFDTIVKVMYETGKDINSGYRETSILGLAKYFKINK
ncbi:MAG: L-serine ammonia-lyase, iron-sulfur-dependent, subunit alpha [Bacilli bacterium]